MYLLHGASSAKSPDGPFQCQAVTVMHAGIKNHFSRQDHFLSWYIDLIEKQ
jgi:hypothetical protein